MHPRLKPIDEQVMVITGATSGIGLATAHMAAEGGAKVVIAARDDNAVRRVVHSLQKKGLQASGLTADVSKRDEVQKIAETALKRYGRVDTWVNNAGTSIFGRLTDVTDEDHRQLFEINFWSVVYGSLIAVDCLKEQGGALINLGSVASDISLPLQGMYSATKHAIKAFTDALRMELEDERRPISVTLIKPTSTNTPFPQHARNYLPHEPRLPDPVYSPEEVAGAILYAAEVPCRDLNVGGAGKAMTMVSRISPRFMDWVSEKIVMKQEQRSEPARNPKGSLYTAGNGCHVHGNHPGHVMEKSLYTRLATHPVAAGLILASAGLMTSALLSALHHRDY